MASFSPSPSLSPGSRKRRSQSWAAKCERCCCSVVTYLPLVFVYGLTTWAIWVEAGIGFLPRSSTWKGNVYISYNYDFAATDNSCNVGHLASIFGVFLYLILNWCYTIAVFTDPGSPLNTSEGTGYSSVPTNEPDPQLDVPSFTVKSTGGSRFCKKCHARKPDRAHHCSTCKRCVLKMDHHCPWLATCVGLRNYKPFMLFLVYTSIFCWLCFGVTAAWLWGEILSDGQYTESFMPINYVMLAVVAGIIGLVLTGFTAWHISLAWRGQTTIECLEKTRYLSPLKKQLQKQRATDGHGGSGQTYSQQLAEIHANALPGVTREEEGEELSYANGDLELGWGARDSLRRNYDEMERDRERDRYEDYLDEQDSEKLPNAFDLGWKRNLLHLFGSKPSLWLVPICNTTGDGWHWEPSSKWLAARDNVRREREAQWREQSQWAQASGGFDDLGEHRNESDRWPRRDQFEHDHLNDANGVSKRSQSGHKRGIDPRSTTSVDSRMSMKTYRRRGSFGEGTEDEDDYTSSADEQPQPAPYYANGEPRHASGERQHERLRSQDNGSQKRD